METAYASAIKHNGIQLASTINPYIELHASATNAYTVIHSLPYQNHARQALELVEHRYLNIYSLEEQVSAKS